MKEESFLRMDYSRRDFLQDLGLSVPTVKLMVEGNAALGDERVDAPGDEGNRKKFAPLNLSAYFTASPRDFGPSPHVISGAGNPPSDGLLRTPTGSQALRGIPFSLGPKGVENKCWIALSASGSAWTTRSVEVPIPDSARFICLAAFCNWDENETPPPGSDAKEKVGQILGDAVLVYADGSEKTFLIRRRFEVNSPTCMWGHLNFASVPHRLDYPRHLTDPLPNGKMWGHLQRALWGFSDSGRDFENGIGNVWLSAFENPEPERPLRALRLEARAEDPLMVCAVTLFRGQVNPLRFNRLSLYRITLPEAAAEEEGRWKVSVDLGIVARVYPQSNFDSGAWLGATNIGLGDTETPVLSGRYLYVEMTASPEAELTLTDTKIGKRYTFDLARAAAGEEVEAEPQGARVEILQTEKVLLHAQTVDSSTHRPTPVRIAFRSREGRYIPPYGHRTEVNESSFEDYGADLKQGDSSFTYVDGTFQVELPVGDVYVEMTKGFEYAPIRKKLNIEPHQREMTLEISRFVDWRSKGWVTADTHVHFLSPTTAILEGQAEGVNLISLLAAQWGDLFTNVGDLSFGPLISPDGETMVQVSSENRQHILGHMALVGGHGAPAFPMSAAGAAESYLGDPLWNSMAEWADMQRDRGGLVVAAHFPYPTGEIAADMVLGKIDAVELYPYTEYFNSLRFLDWYRYLNCGYRVPAVGGTDKMGAYTALGRNRTYAYLGQDEFNFANWKKAVLRGNTFATTGPLLLFQADGHAPGEEIILPSGGGTVEVRAEATSTIPIHRLEVVLNGKVVASRDEKAGTHEFSLTERVSVSGSGWLAARCARLGVTGQPAQSFAAHTSPVYLKSPGSELFSPSDAGYMLTLIEGCQTWVQQYAIRPDQDRLMKITKMLDEAHNRLHRQIRDHSETHR